LTLHVPRRALRSLAYPSPPVATMFEFRWMIDGIVGYRLTLRGRETATIERLHASGRYLKNMGVTTILIDETRPGDS